MKQPNKMVVLLGGAFSATVKTYTWQPTDEEAIQQTMPVDTVNDLPTQAIVVQGNNARHYDLITDTTIKRVVSA